MSWSIVVAGEGNAVALDVERQRDEIVKSTYQTEQSRAQAQTAAAVLAGFARGFPGRLVTVSASGHSDPSYGSIELKASTLIAPKA